MYDAEKEASQHGVHDDVQVWDFNFSRRGSPIKSTFSHFLSGIDVAFEPLTP
jgi:hypothetical protein